MQTLPRGDGVLILQNLDHPGRYIQVLLQGDGLLRLEVRDYLTRFKPLAGAGASATRNDVVALVGLRLTKRGSWSIADHLHITTGSCARRQFLDDPIGSCPRC